MPEAYLSPQLFTFLRQLKRNNNRDWFQKHKHEYEEFVRDPFLRFISDFQPRLKNISPHLIADPRPNGGSLLRIYKDLRFRPDAPPYKTMVAARFPHSAAKQTPAPGFYLHVEQGKSFFAGGLWHPEPETRGKVREAIVNDAAKWKKATQGKKFKALCIIGGDTMKRMPPGYDPNHPLAEDLMRKDFIMWTTLTEDEVCAPDFLKRVVNVCEVAAPFMEFLTRALGLPWSSDEAAKNQQITQITQIAI
jgi:uncharacterized protein (TIGR02453 family)